MVKHPRDWTSDEIARLTYVLLVLYLISQAVTCVLLVRAA